MVMYLQRYFWAVSLAFIASSSLLSARVVNTFVDGALEPGPLLSSDGPRGPLLPATAPNLAADKFGHLFGIEPPPPPAVTAENLIVTHGAKGPICMECEPVKTGLRLQLLATMIASDKHWSMALISDLDAQKTAYYGVGDTIKNVVIYDIVRDSRVYTHKAFDIDKPEPNVPWVVIINEDTHRLEFIDDKPGTGTAVSTAGLGNLGTAPVPGPGDGPVEGITKTGDNRYEITRAKLDATLSNLNDIATQARIVPNFKNGTSNGFKLFSIRPNSLYSAIGIQNGDVITQINGYDMNSPEKALELYTKLKDSRNVKLTYERNGQSVSSEYNITQ
jgi:general secretion pathway protein C